jgi:hypothetical protein
VACLRHFNAYSMEFGFVDSVDMWVGFWMNFFSYWVLLLGSRKSIAFLLKLSQNLY